jgi:molecular chaperone Hsp33
MLRNLMTLGREELTRLTEDPEDLELNCHFCNSRYVFGNKDVKDILDQL